MVGGHVKAWQRKGDHVVAVIGKQEANLLRGLVGQVRDMLTARGEQAPTDELATLTGIRSGPSDPPEDPILQRLLPDFFRLDNAEAGDRKASDSQADSAAALRSLHEPDLVERKTSAGGVVLNTCPERGGRISLDDEQAQAWLSAINDVRLALGTAIDVTEDMPDELPSDDPRAPHLGVYHWLTWMQESLVLAVSG